MTRPRRRGRSWAAPVLACVLMLAYAVVDRTATSTITSVRPAPTPTWSTTVTPDQIAAIRAEHAATKALAERADPQDEANGTESAT